MSREKAKKKEEQTDNEPLVQPAAKAKATPKATVGKTQFPTSKTRTSALKFERARQSKDKAREKTRKEEAKALEEIEDWSALSSKLKDPPASRRNNDDDKPIAQAAREAAPKAKAKAKVRVKATALQKERVRQKTKREDEVPMATLIEEALPKPRKKAKVSSAAQKGDDEVGNAQMS